MKIRNVTLALMLCATTTAFAQDGKVLKQRFEQMGAATKKNQLLLSGYQWRESVLVTVGGDQAPPRQSLCRYAVDGTILKTPVGPAGDDSAIHDGPLPRHMTAKKDEEVADVRQVAGEYVPPLLDELRDAAAKGKVALEGGSQGGPALVFHNYKKPGDEMKLTLDPVSMQAIRIDISTYLENGGSPVTVQVQFARLADDTLYPAQTTIQAPEKRILIATANTNYVRLAL